MTGCDTVRSIVLSLAAAACVYGCRETGESLPEQPAQAVRAVDAVESPPPETLLQTEKVRPSGVLAEFTTVGPESGLDFRRTDDIHGLWRILEVNGGGVGLFDFDRDGRLDVFFNNGCRLPLSLRDRSSKCEFFRNLTGSGESRSNSSDGRPGRDLKFERVTTPSGLLQYGYTYGCAVGDIDNDGFDDLFVTAIGGNGLWANNGDGTFTNITVAAGLEANVWCSSAAFSDLNGDGFLDLYVTTYLDESTETPRLCRHSGSPTGYISCPPAQFDGVDDLLYLSNGAGRFVDCTASAGLKGLKGKGLGVVISDLDQDGRPEIYVANDGEANFLLVRSDPPTAESALPSGGGTPIDQVRFEDRALITGVALSESGYAQAGMGIAVGDCDGDGRQDLYVSHFIDDTNTLYLNRGDLRFDDGTRSSHLGATSRQTLGWGTQFVDFDNDGWLDLVVTNGHVDDRRWQRRGEPYQMPPLLYRNECEGRFSDMTAWGGAYFTGHWLGRGLAAGDLDRDGRIDLVMSHQENASVVLQNGTVGAGNGLTLALVGAASNRNGYGARVELVDTEGLVVRELVGGGSFQSASALEIHVGLGQLRRVKVRIRWPSGLVEERADLGPGRWIAQEGGPICTDGPCEP